MRKKIGIGVLAFFIIVGLLGSGGTTEEAAPSPSLSAALTSSPPRPSPSPSVSLLPSPKVSSQPGRTDAKVVEVVDGDTIKVAINGGAVQTVRIIGVDTPLAAEQQARKSGAGLWGTCGTFSVPVVSQQPKAPPAESGTSSTSPTSGGEA
jgi:endonuclease YncB( thermonuclease family)